MREFKQDDLVRFKYNVRSHDGEVTAGFGSHGKVTVVGIAMEDGSTDGVEVLCENKIFFHCYPSEIELVEREDRPEMLMPEHFGPISEARVLVQKMFYGPNSGIPLALDDVYVVWFCKTLQNWKAMVSSNAKDDAYYEVTHNGDRNETYVDRYIKETNTVHHHDTGISDVTLVNNFGRIY